MSQSKIQKRQFAKAFRRAVEAPSVEDVEPPAELDRISPAASCESLLTATVDGRECQLPFEVLHESSCSPVAEVPHVDATGISRLPFRCPAGGCGQPCSLLVLATHISFDHGEVLLENLWPGETNTVLVDTHVPPEASLPRCHKLYLVSGKVRGLGEGKHRDKLPFALMSSKFTLHGTDRMVLWVTGPDAGPGMRQRYSMEAGRNDPRRLLPYAVAFSGDIVPLHSAQDADAVHRAGAGLIIPEQQLQSLADRRTKLLEVCIHFY